LGLTLGGGHRCTTFSGFFPRAHHERVSDQRAVSNKVIVEPHGFNRVEARPEGNSRAAGDGERIEHMHGLPHGSPPPRRHGGEFAFRVRRQHRAGIVQHVRHDCRPALARARTGEGANVSVIVQADRIAAGDEGAAFGIGFDFAVDHAEEQLARTPRESGRFHDPGGRGEGGIRRAKLFRLAVRITAREIGQQRLRHDAPPVFPASNSGRGNMTSSLPHAPFLKYAL
jgi:hypothetical protein